jgi:hypothetical protein
MMAKQIKPAKNPTVNVLNDHVEDDDEDDDIRRPLGITAMVKGCGRVVVDDFG